jgi:two-component system cell cycle response regulator DivK
MASKQDRIAEKARARKKARDRDRHRVAASRRQHMNKVRDISVEEAAAWPLAECYVGDKWHEDGARVPAIFVRKHPSGRVMAASMDVDLADQGIVDLELWALQTVNELNMKLFHDLLDSQGYETLQTREGLQALALARLHKPDLILMDIQLPEISGLEVTKWLKDDEELSHIPVVAVTAFAMKGDEEKIRQGGCEAYLSKPISVAKFLETVRIYAGSA